MNYSPLQLAAKSYSADNLASNLARALRVGNCISSLQISGFYWPSLLSTVNLPIASFKMNRSMNAEHMEKLAENNLYFLQLSGSDGS
jgi:hypothetical protein